jgi:glycosyltransferase involved in cell wall biosynthesis
LLKLIEVPAENVIFEVMARMILSVTNDLVTDQRVHRVAATLSSKGAKVTLVGRILKNSLPVKRDYKTYRMRLLFTKGPLFYAEYNIRLFLYLLFSKVNVLVANDLDTLPANYLVSVLRKKTLVYDAHELFSEIPELVERNFVKSFWLRLEKWVIPKVKFSYTVCQSIANLFKMEYGINTQVVRNIPVRLVKIDKNNPYPGLPLSEFILYQGSVNKGRGLELLIDAFEYVHQLKCVIVGDGDIMHEINERILNKNLKDKVILLGKLPFEDLKRVTPHAAIGISIEEYQGLNYYYALPNKLFDYIQSEIPVLVSDFPEMRQIVVNYEVGEIVISRNSTDLARQIELMVQKRKDGCWKKSLEIAAKKLCWENEEQELMRIYNKFL